MRIRRPASTTHRVCQERRRESERVLRPVTEHPICRCSVMSVVSVIVFELCADLAGRVSDAVHVHVRRACLHGLHELGELSRGQTLAGHGGGHVGGPDRAGDGSARSRARLCPTGPLPRLVQSQTTIGPALVGFSKWMCACVASLPSDRRTSTGTRSPEPTGRRPRRTCRCPGSRARASPRSRSASR